jgi:hypothetical protein
MSSPPFDYVVHTASPYQMSWEDPQGECLDPAIKGISGLLKSLSHHAPAVKRVVFTSSSAAILNPPNHPKVYDESSWCKITWEEAMDPVHTYRASKVRPSLPRANNHRKLKLYRRSLLTYYPFVGFRHSPSNMPGTFSRRTRTSSASPPSTAPTRSARPRGAWTISTT